jgi:arsenite-transporting ATPase
VPAAAGRTPDVRILLFTGKGGVGKTTLAAATGLRLSELGRSVLVVSTDPAHSLSDVFGVPLGGEPSEVAGTGLCAAQVDARGLVDEAWRTLRGSLRSVLRGLGMAAWEAEELTVVPGVDELLALTEVTRLAGTGRWDAVIVDCGPTAETLRLIALPDAVSGYLERVFPDRGTPRGPAAKAVGALAEHLASLRRVLTDHSVTAARLVVTPERVVVAETRRTQAALALRGIRVDGMVANRVVPKPGSRRGAAAAWLRTRRDEQDAVLAELRADAPAELRIVEHRAAEPVGVAALAELAEELYHDRDPLTGDDPATPDLLRLRPAGDGYRLTVSVPLTPTSDVDLARVGDELAITVDGFRRLVALPPVLSSCAVIDAEAGPDGLVVRFDPPVATEAAAR